MFYATRVYNRQTRVVQYVLDVVCVCVCVCVYTRRVRHRFSRVNSRLRCQNCRRENDWEDISRLRLSPTSKLQKKWWCFICGQSLKKTNSYLFRWFSQVKVNNDQSSHLYDGGSKIRIDHHRFVVGLPRFVLKLVEGRRSLYARE